MIEMPENSLYNDLKFNYNKLPALENCFSPLHVIHNKTVPLHKSARLSVMAQDIDKKITGKALLVEIDTLTGDFKAVTSYYKNGWVTGNIRSFGNYAVAVDTLPPEITPLSIKNKSELTEYSRLRFRISDELSGIKSITGMMDGKWVLFEYDAKSKLITHYFDKERFEMDRLHKLILSVSDQKGNKNTYEASFRR